MATTAWSFGSTTLATYGIVTQINDYLDMPEARGENQTIPYRHGTIFARKFFNERTLSFGIAISTASAAALETALDTLRTKLALRTQQTLSVTLENGQVRTASASVDSPLQVERSGSKFARVVVDFTVPATVFRLSTVIADNTTAVSASPQAMTVANPGTVEERDPTIVIHGAFTAVTITNSTTGAVLTYTGAISTSETVTISTAASGEFTAVLSTGSANVIGNVTHSGESCLMNFIPGDNTIAITSTGKDGNSTVKASFYAPFL
jgi:phage-related protein